MTKKTSTKAAAAKGAKKTATGNECPRGGKHEWVDEGDGRHCEKCKEPAPAKGGKKSKAKPEPARKDKRMSALDAAAKVLAGAKEPMNCGEMIEAMASKGLWTSPGGKTPQQTLYSAILREINVKGKESRFTKTERGRFASTAK